MIICGRVLETRGDACDERGVTAVVLVPVVVGIGLALA
jgi:sirohydrochlorin ferrochelatase